MARYDSPGFMDQVPGMPPRAAHDYMSAPGSTPAPAGSIVSSPPVPHAGPGQAVLVDAYGSTFSASVVSVTPADTEVGPQAGLFAGGDPNPVSGVPGDAVGQSGAGQGTPRGPGHPNAGGA